MKNIVLIAMLMSLLPVTANAYDLDLGLETSGFQSSDFYIGMGHGSGNLSTPHRIYSSCPNGIGTPAVGVRGGGIKGDSDISEIHVGYDVNSLLSLELGYADSSSESSIDPATAGCIATAVALNSRTKIDTETASLTALIKYPINNDFSVYGLLSYDHLHVDKKRYGGFSPTASSETLKDIGYGAGLEWNFSEDFIAKLQWKKTNTGYRANSLSLSDTRLIFEMSL